MTWILEWRAAGGSAPGLPPLAFISHVRVFRTVATLRAFISGRRFAPYARKELRLSCCQQGRRSTPIFTNRAALLAWNPAEAPLPAAFSATEWQTGLVQMAAAEQTARTVAEALARACRADLLRAEDRHALMLGLARALSRAREPRTGP